MQTPQHGASHVRLSEEGTTLEQKFYGDPDSRVHLKRQSEDQDLQIYEVDEEGRIVIGGSEQVSAVIADPKVPEIHFHQ